MNTIKHNHIRLRGKDFAINAKVCFIVISLFLIQGCQSEKTPVVTTGEVSAITGTTATCGGMVEDNGAVVSVRGVCYNTTGRPDINDPHTTDGSGSGNFRSYLTGLQTNTTYYVRAYAGNGNGIIYGGEISFSTVDGDNPDNPDHQLIVITKPVTNISINSAESGGFITQGFATTRGVCYNTIGSPTVNDLITTDGGGSGEYMSCLNDLQPNTTYYVRAYAKGNNGMTYYGEERTFTTAHSLTIPQGWRLSAATSSPAYEFIDGTYISDLMNGYLYDCEKDDIIVFSPNGTHKVLPGTLLCSDDWEFGYNQETSLGSWNFDNPDNPTILYMQIPFFYDTAIETCRIITYNNNMLKISVVINDDEAPAKGTYTFTLTYVPAQ